MKTRNDDDDSILRDGETRSFSMRMLDSTQRSVAEHLAHQAAPLVTDAFGGTEGLHRPGYRYPVPGTEAHVAAEVADALRLTRKAMLGCTPPASVHNLADARERADQARAKYLQRINDDWRPKPAA